MFSLYRIRVPRRVDAWLGGRLGPEAKPTYYPRGGGLPGQARRTPRRSLARPAPTGYASALRFAQDEPQKTTEKNPAPMLSTRAATTNQTIGVRSLRMYSIVFPV
jgi:hypothetical protein